MKQAIKKWTPVALCTGALLSIMAVLVTQSVMGAMMIVSMFTGG